MQDVIERYLYSVVRHLKTSQRESVKKELNSLVHDMLKERMNGREAKEEDIYAVLEELGKPYELAQQYSEANKRGFLNDEYLRVYKGVLFALLPIVVILYILGTYTSSIVSQSNWVDSITTCLEAAVISFSICFTAITIIFVLLQNYHVNIGREEIRNLPPVPKKRKSGKAASYISLIIMFIFGITLLIKPSMLFAAVVDMKRVSIFNEVKIHEFNYVIILFLIIVLIRECYTLIMKGSGLKTLGVTLLLDLVETVLVFALFLRSDIVDTAFINLFEERFPDKKVIVDLFANSNYWIAGLFLVFIIFRNLGNLKINSD